MAESQSDQQNLATLEQKLASLVLSEDSRNDVSMIDLMQQTLEKLRGKNVHKAFCKALESSPLPTYLVDLLQLPNLDSSLYALTSELTQRLLATKCKVPKQMADKGVLRVLENVIATAIPSDDLQVQALDHCVIALGNAARQDSLRKSFTEARSMQVLIELTLRSTAPPSASTKAFGSLSHCSIETIDVDQFGELIQVALDSFSKRGSVDYLHFLKKALALEAKWTEDTVKINKAHINALCNAMSEQKTDEELSSAVLVVGHIVESDAEVPISKELLERVVSLASHKSASIRRDCCWTLSNAFGGEKKVAQLALRAGGLEVAFKGLSTPNKDAKLRMDCAWIVINSLVHPKLLSQVAKKEELLPAIATIVNDIKDKVATFYLINSLDGLLTHSAKDDGQDPIKAYFEEHCPSVFAGNTIPDEADYAPKVYDEVDNGDEDDEGDEDDM